jgi:hypothetical protein
MPSGPLPWAEKTTYLQAHIEELKELPCFTPSLAHVKRIM